MSEQKTPRRPGGRRPLPPLIFLLVLAVLALAVWWKVVRTDEEKTKAANAPCTLTATDQQKADLAQLANIKVHVLNGSGQKGLAAAIGAELTARGFTVLDVGNGSTTSGAGKIEYGQGNEFQAKVLGSHLTGFEIDRSNSITDGTLKLTAGSGWAGLADPKVAANTVSKLVEDQAKIVAGCPSPAPGPEKQPAPTT